MILVVSHLQDAHAAAVIAEIAERGMHCELLDLSRFPIRSGLDCHYGARGATLSYLETGEKAIDLTRVRSVWWRRPQPFAFEAATASLDFARAECEDAISGLWHALDAHWINTPLLDQAAHHKTYQLKLAVDLGLNPPETLVTNNPRSAATFVTHVGEAIYKPFGGSSECWRETRLFGKEEMRKIALIRHAPVILQEFIPGQDYRVTVVGKEVFPAVIDTSGGNYPADFRMNRNMRITPQELPSDVVERIHRLMQRLGLVYGALDFRLDNRDGTFRFLEINPAGQWLFVEEQTRQPISKALADQLIAMAMRDRRRRPPRLTSAVHGRMPASIERRKAARHPQSPAHIPASQSIE